MISKDFLDLLQVLVGVGTIVSLVIAVVSLLLTRNTFQQQMNAHVYLSYTERFERLVGDCPDGFRHEFLATEISTLAPVDRSAAKAAIVRYLNPCSEELYLLRAGYLAMEVWSAWEREIERTLRTPLYRSGWKELRGEFESYPEFIKYVERVQHKEQTRPAAVSETKALR